MRYAVVRVCWAIGTVWYRYLPVLLVAGQPANTALETAADCMKLKALHHCATSPESLVSPPSVADSAFSHRLGGFGGRRRRRRRTVVPLHPYFVRGSLPDATMAIHIRSAAKDVQSVDSLLRRGGKASA